MNLKKLQSNWEGFARLDPLWAIITLPDKKNNKWDIDEFFDSGIHDVEGVMKSVESFNITIQKRKALDFGCGVGRATQALAAYFDEVCGVDIAPTMIELAKKHNRYGHRCQYYLNETNDLRIFSDNSLDFIYSNAVLQHMQPKYSQEYIREFLRILTPHGLLVFQIPSELMLTPMPLPSIAERIKALVPKPLRNLYRKVSKSIRSIENEPVMEMYAIKRKEVEKFIEKTGAKLLGVVQDQGGGPHWVSFRYFVTKE